jgi:hypothetical protein
VYQHTAASLKGALDKSIAFREMFKQVLILYIVDLNRHMCEAFEETLLHRQLEHRKHMSNTSFSERFLSTEREQSALQSESYCILFGGVDTRLFATTGFYQTGDANALVRTHRCRGSTPLKLCQGAP